MAGDGVAGAGGAAVTICGGAGCGAQAEIKPTENRTAAHLSRRQDFMDGW